MDDIFDINDFKSVFIHWYDCIVPLITKSGNAVTRFVIVENDSIEVTFLKDHEANIIKEVFTNCYNSHDIRTVSNSIHSLLFNHCQMEFYSESKRIKGCKVHEFIQELLERYIECVVRLPTPLRDQVWAIEYWGKFVTDWNIRYGAPSYARCFGMQCVEKNFNFITSVCCMNYIKGISDVDLCGTVSIISPGFKFGNSLHHQFIDEDYYGKYLHFTYYHMQYNLYFEEELYHSLHEELEHFKKLEGLESFELLKTREGLKRIGLAVRKHLAAVELVATWLIYYERLINYILHFNYVMKDKPFISEYIIEMPWVGETFKELCTKPNNIGPEWALYKNKAYILLGRFDWFEGPEKDHGTVRHGENWLNFIKQNVVLMRVYGCLDLLDYQTWKTTAADITHDECFAWRTKQRQTIKLEPEAYGGELITNEILRDENCLIWPGKILSEHFTYVKELNNSINRVRVNTYNQRDEIVSKKIKRVIPNLKLLAYKKRLYRHAPRRFEKINRLLGCSYKKF